MWNDNTDIPLAYLITFRCYGTWLHGDDRGSVNRFRNAYGTERLPGNEDWLDTNRERLILAPVRLNAAQRKIVDLAIYETCEFRSWNLHAKNVRTNHAHVAVGIGTKKPGIALNAFKANATRLLREHGLWKLQSSPWSARGSKRYLWNEKSLFQAIDYVINGQGDDLPDFGR
jgi:REP element-mobilizing transposase RayT